MLLYSQLVLIFSIFNPIFSSLTQRHSSYLASVDVTTLKKVVFCMKDATRSLLIYDSEKIDFFHNPFDSLQDSVMFNTGTLTPLIPTQCVSRDNILMMNDWGDLGKGTIFNGMWNYETIVTFGIECDSTNGENIQNSQGKIFFSCIHIQNLNFFSMDFSSFDIGVPIISIDATGFHDSIMNFIDCSESNLLEGVTCIYGLDNNAYVHLISIQGPAKQVALQNILSFIEGRIVQIDSSVVIAYYDINGLHCFHGAISLDTPAISSTTIITIGSLTDIQHTSLAQCVKKQNKLWLKASDYAVTLGCIDSASISIFVINVNDLSIQKLQLEGSQNGDYQFLYFDAFKFREITLAWLEKDSSLLSFYQLKIPYCSNNTASLVKGEDVPFTISSIFPALDNNLLEFKLKEPLSFGVIVFQPSNAELVVGQYYLIDPLHENVEYTSQLEGSENIQLTGISLEKMKLTCSFLITIAPLSIANCPRYTITQGNVCINCKDTWKYYYNDQCLSTQPPNTFYVDTDYNAIEYCYPLCQTCNSKGTSGDHQCTSCINGYILDRVSSSQCISSQVCTEYYYFDSNGLKKCTSSCTVSPFIYILYSCKQCLDNCNSPEACESSYSLRYVYANYCLTKCPMATTRNNRTLLCDPCVNEEYLIYSYRNITDWINSVTKDDLIEFAKNDSIIINENYIIDIYNTTNGNRNSSSTSITDKLNISRLTLTECAIKLKKHYNIPDSDPLIILKIDIDNAQLITNQVEYEIYSFDGLKLDLSICSNTIIIEAGIKSDDRINWELALNLSLQGIDMFNTQDKFYNDFCFPYSTNVSTDVLIEDRRTDIFPNISLCQANCTYKSINYTAMKVECECNIAPHVDPAPKAPSLIDKFIDSFVSSNIEVATCFKLVFDFNYLRYNIAFWLYLVFIFIQLMMIFLYAFHDFLSLKQDVNGRRIAKRMSSPKASPIKKAKEDKNAEDEKINKNTRQSVETVNFDNISGNQFIQTKSVATTENEDMSPNRILNKRNIPSFFPSQMSNFVHSPEITKKVETNNEMLTLNSSNLSIAKKKRLANRFGSIMLQAIPIERDPKKFNFNKKENEKRKNEIITYEDSLKNDKRPIHKMFWEIFIEKDIIFNTIFELERYQRISIKIINCIFSIALDFSFNALFCSVDVIANTYDNEGVIDLLFSLPKALYSALASIFLLWILSCFSSTNWTFRSFGMKRRFVKKFIRCILIKHIVFFLINFILMICFWYFSVAFCSVYYNNQIYWLIDSCISTMMGIALAVCVSLSITTLRILSLRYKLKCLFETCRIWQSL